MHRPVVKAQKAFELLASLALSVACECAPFRTPPGSMRHGFRGCVRVASSVAHAGRQFRGPAAMSLARQLSHRQFQAAVPVMTAAKPPKDTETATETKSSSTKAPKIGLLATLRADLASMRAETAGMTMFGSIKHLGQKYGIVAFVVYETLWIGTIGGSYLAFAAVR